mmetsp:Transcript_2237/g.6357  ORF Transcript_2237/g.6357 Transcript_2237/m.6357 type:complete len:213 (+) Transcript_2237:57-695(+)
MSDGRDGGQLRAGPPWREAGSARSEGLSAECAREPHLALRSPAKRPPPAEGVEHRRPPPLPPAPAGRRDPHCGVQFHRPCEDIVPAGRHKVPSAPKANALPEAVIHGVVLPEDRLAQDEELRAQGRRQIQCHKHWDTPQVVAVMRIAGNACAVLKARHLCVLGGVPDLRIFPRAQGDGVVVELEVQERAGSMAMACERRRVPQRLVELPEGR